MSIQTRAQTFSLPFAGQPDRQPSTCEGSTGGPVHLSVHGKTLFLHLFLKYVGVLNMQVCFSRALGCVTAFALARSCWKVLLGGAGYQPAQGRDRLARFAFRLGESRSASPLFLLDNTFVTPPAFYAWDS